MENNEYVVTEEVQEEAQEEPKKKKGLFGHEVEEEPGKHSKYAVLSAKTYFWSIFIMSIPALGWLIAIIWACGLTRNKNRSNLAKAMCINIFIFIVCVTALMIVAKIWIIPNIEAYVNSDSFKNLINYLKTL